MSFILPEQAIPDSKKDKAWRRACIEYYVNQAQFSSGVYAEMLTLYRAAEGRLTKNDYNYVLNPYGVEEDELKAYPARLRNYDIIGPVIDMLLGENSKRPFDDQVIAVNADVESRFKKELSEKMATLLSRVAVNTLNKEGLDTGVPQQEVPELEEANEKYKTTWTDDRAIIGQEALDYIRNFCDLDEKFQQLIYDWYCTGRFFSYKEVLHNDVNYEVVSPLDIWAMKSDISPFIEDGVAVVRRRRMTVNEVLDRWRHKLDAEDLRKLEMLAKRISPPADGTGYIHLTNEMMDGITVNYNLFRGGYIDCYHVCWKSF